MEERLGLVAKTIAKTIADNSCACSKCVGKILVRDLLPLLLAGQAMSGWTWKDYVAFEKVQAEWEAALTKLDSEPAKEKK